MSLFILFDSWNKSNRSFTTFSLSSSAICPYFIKKRIGLKKNEEEVKQDIAEVENQIKSLMGTHSVAIAGKCKITWSNSIKKIFDSKAFKEKCPDTYKNT